MSEAKQEAQPFLTVSHFLQISARRTDSDAPTAIGGPSVLTSGFAVTDTTSALTDQTRKAVVSSIFNS